jgi:hypothetical protein
VRKSPQGADFGGLLEDGWGSGSVSAFFASDNLPNPVKYLVKPPRFRWVYDTPPEPPKPMRPPYRRIHPRDDGLAGGAPRTWPLSKSLEASNRTFGGYL